MLTKIFRQYPRQVPFIIGNEACERFSFYGMRNILTIFLVEYLLAGEYANTADATVGAKAVFHTFVMAVYFFPVLGGWLADRYLGKYRTILWLSCLYCVGHACLAIFEHSKLGFYSGLSLIALGSGGIKPCVSSLIADQFDQSNKHLVRSIFGIFYWSINIGSFCATLLMPVLLQHYGPAVAFGVPGIFMALATFIFWWGRADYVESSTRDRSPLSADAVRAVVRMLPLFVMVAFFWAIFDQKASTVVLQAQQMERTVFGITILAAHMQVLNPLLVMGLVPLFNGWLYPWLERIGLRPTPLRRMTTGIALSGVAFVLVAVLQLWIEQGARPTILWQVLPYIVLTAGEVLVSVTGLEFAYAQAPLEAKSVIMSLWLLTTTLGNLLVVVITELRIYDGAQQIFLYAGLAFLASALFAFFARNFKEYAIYRAAAAT